MKLQSLIVLRGFGAIAVVCFHLTWYGGEPPWLGRALLSGARGVDLFFVLSGFSLTYGYATSAGRWRQLPAYAVARFWRIFPLYWMVYMATTAYSIWRTMPLPENWCYQALLIPDGQWVVPQSWTMPHELIAYTGFGAIFLGWPALLFTVVAWFLFYVGGLTMWPIPMSTWVASFYVGEFVIGVVLAVTLRHVCYNVSASLRLFAVVLAVAVMANESYRLATTFVYMHTPMLLASVLLTTTLVLDELQTARKYPRLLLVLGEASYSIYLTHYYVIWEVDGWLFSVGVLNRGLTLVIVLLVGVATWWAIERPLLRLRPQWTRGGSA